MVSSYHGQLESARKIWGDFLSSVCAQLKSMLHITQGLSHDRLVSQCCKFPVSHNKLLCIFFPVMLVYYRIANFGRNYHPFWK